VKASLPESEQCTVFGGLPGGLDPTTIHRFVVGEDPAPKAMTPDEARAELGDPFATLLLLQGKFPRSGAEVIEALKAAVPDADQLSQHKTFVLGEGSKIPVTPATNGVIRAMRFVVATGGSPVGPDVMISVFHPNRGDVELMAWDRVKDGFNFYRTVNGAWVWAGNSRHAVTAGTEGKGVFHAHPTGNFLMKELKIPWVHWRSFKADIDPGVFGAGSSLATHPWFTDSEGAEACERQVALPSIRRWTKARFEQAVDGEGLVARPGRIMQQILRPSTVNLASSQTASRAVGPGGDAFLDLPGTFFFDAALSSDKVGLPLPPAFQVSADLYLKSLETFAFVLDDGNQVADTGDTHFAFVVPERAFEDDATLEAALDLGLVTPRLAACLLMVDFPNPVFSALREQLLEHVPGSATIVDGASTFSEEMASNILARAAAHPDDLAATQFAARWNVGETDWPATFGAELNAYFAAVTAQLLTQQGFDDYQRLAAANRVQVSERFPIVEFGLLFPRTNIKGGFVMKPDATVQKA
jgi:hypothetical protein